jgi:prefoldin subunit 5
MDKCKYCGLDAGTHACDPKDVTINMQKQDIAILRQQVAELEAVIVMQRETIQTLNSCIGGEEQ